MDTKTPRVIAPFERWLELYRCASAWGALGLESFEYFLELRQRRDRWLVELSQAMDRYLRSPAFLELMKLNLKAMSLPMRFVLPPSPTGESSNGHRVSHSP